MGTRPVALEGPAFPELDDAPLRRQDQPLMAAMNTNWEGWMKKIRRWA